MENFKSSLKEMERAEAILNELNNYAIALGVKERGMNASNSAKACFKALNEYLDLIEAVEALGSTLPNILKSYRMKNKSSESIPDEMRFAPPHWISDARLEKDYVWVNGKKIEKIYRRKEITAASARRLRTGIQSQIADLFAMIGEQNWSEEDKEDLRLSIISDYKTLSYHDFSSRLCDSLWKLNLGSDGSEDGN